MYRENPVNERATGEALQQAATWMGQLQLFLGFVIFLFKIHSHKGERLWLTSVMCPLFSQERARKLEGQPHPFSICRGRGKLSEKKKKKDTISTLGNRMLCLYIYIFFKLHNIKWFYPIANSINRIWWADTQVPNCLV